MRSDRLPGAKVITAALWVVLIGGLAIGVTRYWQGTVPSLPPKKTDEKTTLSLLKSEAIKFLVVRKTTAQIVVEYEEENWAGHWRGVLWGVVHLHYGVDLERIVEADIRRDGDIVVVKLPEPELMAFTVEPGSIGCLTKSTAVPKVQDLMNNGHRKILEGKLRARAMKFARQHGLMPTRARIVSELNDAIKLFADRGVRIRFE